MNEWNALLPKTLDVCGTSYSIRSDYRAALDICKALSDPELDDREKTFVAFSILYEDFEDMPQEHYEEAAKKCVWFLNCGEVDDGAKSPKLMDWEQDFKYIVAPINRVIGKEVRSLEYLHWWTFISAYQEIGDCLFAQIVRIRDMKARGKPLDKADREFYRRNKKIIDLKQTYSESEKDILKAWTKKAAPETGTA